MLAEMTGHAPSPFLGADEKLDRASAGYHDKDVFGREEDHQVIYYHPRCALAGDLYRKSGTKGKTLTWMWEL